jgi:hypothetical protein
MFRRRRATGAEAQREQQAVDREAPGLADGRPLPTAPEAHLGEVAVREPRTLDTVCSCGHTRRDHTGLRIEIDGRCLECGCPAFTSAGERQNAPVEVIERMQAAIARVERIQELAEGLRDAQLRQAAPGNGPRPADRRSSREGSRPPREARPGP